MAEQKRDSGQGLIVGAGFQKTGTSSLRDALNILGYNVKDTNSRALLPILRGNYSKILSMLNGYDAVEDTPWYKIYKELDQHIPNSKFILTIRDEESWYNSVAQHIGDLRSAQHEWIYGRGKGLPKEDKENTIRVYREHNREVQDYFKDRPDDLLVIDFTKGEKWERICAFLGKDIPNVDFPHRNHTRSAKSELKKNSLKFQRKQIKSNFKIRYIDMLGLWEKKDQ